MNKPREKQPCWFKFWKRGHRVKVVSASVKISLKGLEEAYQEGLRKRRGEGG